MDLLPADPKIIDLLQKREDGSKPFVSIEFFPPRSDEGVKVRAYDRLSFLSLSLVGMCLSCVFLINGLLFVAPRICMLGWSE